MTKSLSEQIAEEETTLRGVSNRAAFIVVRDEVRKAIDDGWSVRAIWRTLHKQGRIPCGYEAFRTYVNRLVVGHRPKGNPAVMAERKSLAKNGLPPGRTQPSQEMSEHSSTPKLPGFKFNRIPKKEDLF